MKSSFSQSVYLAAIPKYGTFAGTGCNIRAIGRKRHHSCCLLAVTGLRGTRETLSRRNGEGAALFSRRRM